MNRLARRMAAAKRHVQAAQPQPISPEEEAAGKELIDGCRWEQKQDMDQRFLIVTLRFPAIGTEEVALAGKEAFTAIARFAKSVVGG